MNNLQTSICCNNTQFILHVLIHFWTNNNIEDLLCAALYKFPSGPTYISILLLMMFKAEIVLGISIKIL